MTPEELRTEICKMRENDKSYGFIGNHFGLPKPAVRRIEKGEKISRYLAKKLDLEPSKKLQATRMRRSILNKIGQYWKYENWSDYETKVIENFEKNFDFETGKWKDK